MNDEDFSQASVRRITWRIQNFRNLPTDAGYSLDSPRFGFEDATWCLRLYPKNRDAFWMKGIHHTEEEKGCVGLTLVRLSSLVPRHQLDCSFFRCDSFFTDTRDCVGINFDDDCKENGIMSFIERFDVFGSLSEVRKTGCLTVACEVSLHGSSAVDPSLPTEVFVLEAKAVGTLCQNYKYLLHKGQGHDVVLKVRGKKFRAHQCVLRARSPVMASMLIPDTMQKNGGVVDIPDCDPRAFKQFLSYVYYAKLETLNEDNMLSLYHIASKYELVDMKEKCRELIQKSLSSGNITDVIENALKHCDEVLLHHATDYFVKEVNQILPTVQWRSFLKRNFTKANELVIKAVKNLSGRQT